MFNVTLITMGKLKEKFYLSAAEEYKKRLSGYCKFNLVELPEYRLPDDPSPAEIEIALKLPNNTLTLVASDYNKYGSKKTIERVNEKARQLKKKPHLFLIH